MTSAMPMIFKPEFLEDKIYVDGSILRNQIPKQIFLINKPIGVISTCHDERGREAVVNLLPKRLRQGLHPVGRLDSDSRGAILLTNDGELTLRLTHPSFLHPKTYLVWVHSKPSDQCLNKWRDGVLLDGKRTMKATIELLRTVKNVINIPK